MQKPQDQDNKAKVEDLLKKRQETIDKVRELYKNFRGVSHENSAAEIKQVKIKVYEGFVDSLNKELLSLGYDVRTNTYTS